jgi:uncharacterized membrane protein
MSDVRDPNISEQVKPWLRIGLRLANLLLVAGVVAALFGYSWQQVLTFAGLGLLVVLPVLNVVVGLVDELRLRQWKFVAAAAVVLLILSVNILHRW